MDTTQPMDWRKWLFGVVMALLLACGGDDDVVDAGVDAAVDSGVDAAAPVIDAGACSLDCPVGESCCVIDGSPQCINLDVDGEHCGQCGRTCGGGRGTHCALGQCVCGAADVGCAGDGRDICCPPVGERVRPYCANIQEEPRDCGGCGNRCDESIGDRCEFGECTCGLEERGCAGTPTDFCCPDVTEFACANLQEDRRNCGRCGRSCDLVETCREGTCSFGRELCEGGCGEGEICCRGACCARGMCEENGCAGSLDAGMDAGDAGVDAGA